MTFKKILWTKRGVIRLGMFIKSKRAIQFRNWAENLILGTVDDKKKNVTPLKRGYNIIGNENLTNIFQSTAYDNNFINIVYEIAAYWKGVSDFSRGRLATKIETSLEQCRKRPE